MCLIINKPAGVQFDEKFLLGTYNKNKDGIGIMYAENDVLYSAKQVPRSFEDIKAFWSKYVLTERECVVHFRLQTHGPVETKNAHPFEVLGADDGYPLYLIHNGILHTDNHEDPSQTDTALYIKNYLRPMLLKNPEFFLTPAFSEIIGEHIGHGNRFVLLDAYGNRVTVNENTGVEHNGAWLSNTYAWDTSGTEHDVRNRGIGKFSGYTHGNVYGSEDDLWEGYGFPKHTPALVEPFANGNVAFEEEGKAYDALQAVDDFYDELLDAMHDKGMDLAMGVSYAEIQFYFDTYGADAYTLIDMINMQGMTEAEVIEEIQSVQMVGV